MYVVEKSRCHYWAQNGGQNDVQLSEAISPRGANVCVSFCINLCFATRVRAKKKAGEVSTAFFAPAHFPPAHLKSDSLETASKQLKLCKAHHRPTFHSQ